MSDKKFSIITLGDVSAGKTSIIKKFLNNDEDISISGGATIGVDFFHKDVTVNDTKVTLSIYDTSGQERFAGITASYYKRSQGVIMVFDLTSVDSFGHVDKWLNQLKVQHDIKDLRIVLLGNKCDLEDEIMISDEEATKRAESIGTKYFKTSAKTGKNIEEAMHYLALELVKRDDNMLNDALQNDRLRVDLYKHKNNKKKHCCN